MSLSLCFCFSSCSEIKDIIVSELEEGRETEDDDDDDRHDITGRQTTVVDETSYETFEPTGTYTTEPVEIMDVDAEYLRSVYIFTTWYDVIDDNPIDENRVYSEDAYAIKNVFYFNTPLTVVLEARLYQNDELIMTKEIYLKNNVTAEADFSAGLEGLGTFSPGQYTVHLIYADEEIAVSDPMEVA